MGLIQRIKDYFNRNKVKLLPEPELSYYQENLKVNDNSWIISDRNGYSNEPLTQIDIDINNFLNTYYQKVAQSDVYAPINNYKIAYASLVQSNEQITQEDYNYNRARENEFLTDIQLNQKYQLTEENGFYHLQSQNYQMPKFENMARVYVNCRSKHIADVAEGISELNTNSNFYIKFVANDSNVQGPRKEKMVIYCDKNEVDYTLGLIQNYKTLRQEYFENSQALPFLENINDIASVAFQPLTDQYVNLYGQTKQIPQSVNAFITNMLQESYIESAREVARADSNLSFLLDPSYYYNETLYVQNYPYIYENYGKYLLNSMKAKLEVLSSKNNIKIKEITQEYQDYQNNYQYNKAEDYQQY